MTSKFVDIAWHLMEAADALPGRRLYFCTKKGRFLSPEEIDALESEPAPESEEMPVTKQPK